MLKKHSMQAGVTLVELITWMALSSLLLAAVGGIFSSSAKLWNYGNHQYDVQQTASLVLNTLTNDLRYGSSNDISKGFEADLNVNASTGQSITFASHKDDKNLIGKKTYYINKDDNKLYCLQGNNAPVLVSGQNKNSNIFFLAPTDGGKVFDIGSDKKSVNINLRVVAIGKAKLPISESSITNDIKLNRMFVVQTTVTLLDSFVNIPAS